MDRNIFFDRERFLKGHRYYAQHRITAQTSQLRIEVPLVNGKGTYDFDIRKEIKRASEKTLKRNDLFIVRAVGLGLMAENPDKEGHAPLMSYPMLKSNALPKGVAGFENSDANVVYNGSISLKTGQTTNFSDFPTSSFKTVPETQPVAILNADGDEVSAQLMPQFKMENMLFELPEEIKLAGTQDHTIRLELPANSETDYSVSDTDNKDYVPYVVLVFEGWLFEGATNQKFKDDDLNPYASAI